MQKRPDPDGVWYPCFTKVRIGYSLVTSGAHAWRVIFAAGAWHMPASSDEVQNTNRNQESDQLDTREKMTTTMKYFQCTDIIASCLDPQKRLLLRSTDPVARPFVDGI